MLLQLSATQGYAHLILECPAVGTAHDTLVDDGETQGASIGCRQVASQCRDARHRTSLGFHIVVSRRVYHALLQGAIDAGNRQGGHEMLQDVGRTVGMYQEAHQQFRTDVVVEGKARAVGNAILFATQSQAFDQLARDITCLSSLRQLTSAGSCRLIEHGFGIEIIAVFQHAFQNHVNGMAISAQRTHIAGCRCFLQLSTHQDYALALELALEGRHEDILATNRQGNQHGIVVVPAPALTIVEGLLHGAVGHKIAAYRIDTLFTDALHHRGHIVGCQRGVEAANHIEVTLEGSTTQRTGIAEARLILIIATQTVQRRDGSDQLHGGGRAHQLTCLMLKEYGVALQIIDQEAHLGGLEEGIGQ